MIVDVLLAGSVLILLFDNITSSVDKAPDIGIVPKLILLRVKES
jgi:hypothetical protein